jgi:hypothetical protein
MAKTRKRLRLIVEVSVPADMPADKARREVKSLISTGAGYDTYAGEDVKAISVESAAWADKLRGRQ